MAALVCGRARTSPSGDRMRAGWVSPRICVRSLATTRSERFPLSEAEGGADEGVFRQADLQLELHQAGGRRPVADAANDLRRAHQAQRPLVPAGGRLLGRSLGRDVVEHGHRVEDRVGGGVARQLGLQRAEQIGDGLDRQHAQAAGLRFGQLAALGRDAAGAGHQHDLRPACQRLQGDAAAERAGGAVRDEADGVDIRASRPAGDQDAAGGQVVGHGALSLMGRRVRYRAPAGGASAGRAVHGVHDPTPQPRAAVPHRPRQDQGTGKGEATAAV